MFEWLPSWSAISDFWIFPKPFEKKNACQNMVAMETSSHVDSNIHIKLLPDNFWKRHQLSLVAFGSILKK